jgi:hypothetical protein
MGFQATSLRVCLVIALAPVFAGCDEESAVVPRLSGIVQTVSGAPVAGAGVLVEYDLREYLPAGAKPATGIRFAIAAPGHVLLCITAPCEVDTVRVLCDGWLAAGVHEITWDARDQEGLLVCPGLYVTNLRIGDSLLQHELFQQEDGFAAISDLEGRRWHAFTPARGSFSLPLACLSFGATIDPVLDEQGNPIGPQIQIPWRARVWAVAPGLGTAASDWTEVDAHRGARVRIVVPD